MKKHLLAPLALLLSIVWGACAPGRLPSAATYPIAVVMCGDGEVNVNGTAKRPGPDNVALFPAVPGSALNKLLVIYKAPGDAKGVQFTFNFDPGPHQILIGSCRVMDRPGFQAVFKLPEAARHINAGLVRVNGKSLVDDNGDVSARGVNLFGALWYHEHDHDLSIRNLRKIAEKHNSVHIFAQIDWYKDRMPWISHDVVADPFSPTYQLASFIDEAWALGLRTEITVCGGSCGGRPMDAARIVGDIIEPRQQKVIMVDNGNEIDAVQQLTLDQDAAMTAYFRGRFPLMPLAFGSRVGGDHLHDMVEAVRGSKASAMSQHTSRGQGGNGWDGVAMVSEVSISGLSISSSEPQGLCSSVAQYFFPIQFGMAAATSRISGAAIYDLHVADMIDGTDRFDERDCGRQLKPYLGDVPGIDPIIDAVATATNLLPVGVENWTRLSGQAAMPSNANWATNSDHGIHSSYASVKGNDWVMAVNGVLAQATFTAPLAAHLQAFDASTGLAVVTVDLQQGQSFTVPGRGDGLTGYIFKWTTNLPPSPINGIGTPDEWHTYFNSVLARLGITAANVNGLEATVLSLAIYGAEWQHDSAGNLRARLFLPTDVPGEPYKRAIDVWTAPDGGTWTWTIR